MVPKKFKTHVKEIENHANDCIILSLSTPEDFTFKAGQFITLYLKDKEKKLPRSYSILNPPSEEGIKLCITLVKGGFASEIFKNLKLGEELEAMGPLGNFTFDEEAKVDEHFFIGTGSGIVPLISMIKEYLTKLDKKFTLLSGHRYKEDLILHKELQQLDKNNKNFTYIPTITREEWDGKTGRVQIHLPKNLENKKFYICGLKEMVIETKDLLLEKGVNNKNISYERYN
ncbi:MAG: FAD-binding oxidoreductase [Nanoarchaeota archaeon]|nr:FAD-binding oxidoreductase [Nanoarchaeota archaeon]